MYKEISSISHEQAETLGGVYSIKLNQLHPHPQNPYEVIDDQAMQELVESVTIPGVLVPAIARPKEDGGYELIASHRRMRTSHLAGWNSMPVSVMNV